ncbi:sensor histidine kinase [Turicibacter sanguinis]|nr:sensor histidine kinase [Turicibacter sanguinis]MTP48360.1 sensor histidine kinase [Turicibacter sanguinis]MTP50434.1 sensor histidine kinase [Turicibacter sanguinis]MTQ06745.1 sensor histidine kinase [Turicibacter sanguinis]
MRLGDYLKDKIMVILLNVFMLFLLCCFLLMVNNLFSTILIISIVWIVVLVTFLMVDFYRRSTYFNRLDKLLNGLNERYLIAEVMEKSYRLEDQKYREILRKSNKSVIEKINELEDEQTDYREYIESWVHEIKLPLTTMELICENHKDAVTRKVQSEIIKVEHFVEMVLFYARSEKVYQDYLIQELNLQSIIYDLIGRNKMYLIQNQMSVEVKCADLVCCDKLGLSFILNQLLVNAVKYKKPGGGQVRFWSECDDDFVRLVLEDDGIGIKESELGRIFDKGFTGSNGRNQAKSTGMGLYLCDKLCKGLGIELSVESQIGEYTRMILIFPKQTFLSKL